MNHNHQEILELISQYLEQHPELRFTQALFNLGINRWEDPKNPESFRDNYADPDTKILQILYSKTLNP